MSVQVACRRNRCVALVASVIVAVVGLVAPATSTAQALPTPYEFVSQLDLKCYKMSSSSTGLGLKLQLTHLNPVLIELGMPVETVVVGGAEQLCVPVAKEGVIPPPAVLRFIEYVDLACYTITAFSPATKMPLSLKHLNPVLQRAGAPDEQVTITRPQQLCVPVAKNNKIPPPEVRRLVQYIDLKCYELFTTTDTPPIGLRLTHLNPVLRDMGLPDEEVRMRAPKQLCVPVIKGTVAPPTEVRNIIQWLDLKKYELDAPAMAPVTLVLTHLNPLLAKHPQEKVVLTAAQHIGVPVAKNGKIPPTQ